jgi:endo-1,4-beta-D-glucanase Y
VTRRGRVHRAVALAVVVLLAGAAVALATSLGWRGSSDPGADDEATARGAATRFLDRYADADGRVVRRDQGGDTVSEGQAYALLLAAATRDRHRFATVWSWTRRNLQRDDGVLASRWAGGAVADHNAATDADLDAARALLLAAQRFHRPDYRRAALRIGRGILGSETVTVGDRLVLVAGPWARERRVVNPSYHSPRALAALGRASRDRRWARLARSGREIATVLQAHRSGLVPDWAVATPAGATPIGTPDDAGAQARYGFDAVRLPVRMAEACGVADRRRAAAAWRGLRPLTRGPLPAVLDLGASPLQRFEHPAALVGAAGAAAGAGDHEAAARLLDRAARVDARAPTYYGAAWVALGRAMLTTDLLGRCR